MSKIISTKLIGILSVLALVLLSINLASALTLSTPASLTANDDSSPFTITNDDSVAVNVTLSVADIVSGSSIVSLDLDPSAVNNLANGASATSTVSIQDITGNFDFGEHEATITANSVDAATGAAVDSATTTVTYLKSFCKAGAKGDLEIRKVNVDNLGEGKDDEWQLLDEITVTVEVKNAGNDDIDDVFVEIGLLDSSGDNVIGDLDFTGADEEEIDVGRIRDGDKEELTFEFTVPADFSDGDYSLVVKAYSDDAGESSICADTSNDLDGDYFQALTVDRESDEGKFISFQNINVQPSPATCGDTLSLTMDVYNIGDEDQDQVKINVRSSGLGIDTFQEIRSNLDQGDKQRLSFSFIVPQVADGTYNLEIDSEYDYRSGTYRQSSDDTERVIISVAGCTPTPGTGTGPVAGITASLDSDAVAGQELTVSARITNFDSEPRSFVIGVSGFEAWASLSSVSERVVSLLPGETREVVIKMDVDADIEGRQSFVLEARSGTDVETREVSVSIEGKEASAFGGISLGDNTLIWVIGIINVILIVLIIVAAVRLSRR